MPASVVAAVTSLQEIPSGHDQKAILEVIVQPLDELRFCL